MFITGNCCTDECNAADYSNAIRIKLEAHLIKRALASVLAISAMILPGISLAADWTGLRKIVGIEAHATSTEVRLEGQASGNACTKITENGLSLTWANIPHDMQNRADLVALVMMAYASGREVNMYCADESQWAPVTMIKVEE